MKKMPWHRMLALALSLCMLLSMAPVSAFADEDGVAAETAEEAASPVDAMPADEVEEAEEIEVEGIVTYADATSGECGTNLTWTLVGGTLTISGTGAMSDYSSASGAPWYSNRSSITAVVVESGVTHVGKNAFNNYYNMATLTLPESVVSIGESAFYTCYNLKTAEIPGVLSTVGRDAFNGCSNMSTSVTISASIIKQKAFYGCQTLQSVTLQDSVKTIESNAFQNCKALTSIHLPDITLLGQAAFSGCTNLESANIPASVKHQINPQVFQGCTSLKNVTLEEGLTYLTYSLFEGCTSLETIVIPDSVTTMPKYIFQNCTSLKNVTLPAAKMITTGENWFAGCTSLTEITIPEKMISVPNGAFYGCTNLETVNLPTTLTKIWSNAFKDCSKLTQIAIPTSVTEIGDNAFDGAPVETVTYGGTREEWNAITGNQQLPSPFGEEPEPTPEVKTETVSLRVGENETYTDETGNYAGTALTDLDTDVATVTLTGISDTYTAGSAVNALTDGQYAIVNNRANKPMTNGTASQDAEAGMMNGMSLTGSVENLNAEGVWNITAVTGGYTVQDCNGRYLTIGSNAAGLSDTESVIAITYNAEGYWNLSQNNAYLNDAANKQICAAGWQDSTAAADSGSKWTLRPVTASDTGSTTITITGVGVGETAVTIGGTKYAITVSAALPEQAVSVRECNDLVIRLEGDKLSTLNTEGLDTSKATVSGVVTAEGETVGDLSGCLFTFTKSDDVYTISHKLDDGTVVYLNHSNSSTIPLQTDPDTVAVTAGANEGMFKLTNQSDNKTLHFHMELDEPYWNRCGTDTSEKCQEYLFRSAEAGEDTTASPIRGYVQLTGVEQITDGGEYLIAAKTSNGAWYILRPTVSATRTDYAEKIAAGCVTKVTVHGVAQGETSFILDGNRYVVTVKPYCEHANTELRNAVTANCQTEGYTGDTYCTDCHEKLAEGKSTGFGEHDYQNGICSVCQKNVANIEVANVTDETLLKAGADQYPTGTTQEQPFPGNFPNITNFRIPGMVTLKNGWIATVADARYSTGADGGGLDTIFSVSKDGGKTWNYSMPVYFPDSDGYSGINATTIIDPIIVQANDGTIYIMVDVNPTGCTTMYCTPGMGTGYVTVDGVSRLALTSDYSKVTVAPTADNTDVYDYYVGDLGEDGYAPIIHRATKIATNLVVDECFNIYQKNSDGTYSNPYQTQVNTNTRIQQNVFYEGSVLHVYKTGYMWVAESRDNGETWHHSIINDQVKRDTETGLLVSPGRGTILSDGTIIMPYYNHFDTATSAGTERASLVWSRDNGKTWHRGTDIQGGWSSESELVELYNGTVRLFVRNGNNTVGYADAKWDEAQNAYIWTTNLTSTGVSSHSGCNVSAIKYSQKIDGKMAVLVACPGGTGRNNGKIFVFLVNEDNTMECKYTFSVNDSGYAYSCLTELEDGRIGLLWEPNGSPTSILYSSFDMDEICNGAEINGQRTIHVGLYETFTERLAAAFQPGELSDPSVAEVKVDSKTTTTTLAATGTDSTFGGLDIPLEDCLYTFTTSGDGYVIESVENPGLFLSHKVSSAAGIPNCATSVAISIVSGSTDGAYAFQDNVTTGGSGKTLYFWKNESSGKTYSFDRQGGTDANGATDFLIFAPAAAGVETPAIPGYVQVTAEKIVSGGKYLIVAKAGDSYYALRPSTGSNRYDHVVKVGGVDTTTVTTVTYTGLKAGTTTFTETVSGQKYVIKVADKANVPVYVQVGGELIVPVGEDATITRQPAADIATAELLSGGEAQMKLTGVGVGTTDVIVGNTMFRVQVWDRGINTQNVELKPGESASFTELTGNYEGDALNGLNTNVATAQLEAEETGLYMVRTVASQLTSGKQYVIRNTRRGKLLSNAATSGSGATGLSLNGAMDQITGVDVWTVTQVEGGFAVRDASGNYLTVGSSTAAVTETATTLSLTYDESLGIWTIGQGSYYLNNFGGSGSACAAGYTVGSSDEGSRWEFYPVGELKTATTQVTFTGVGKGTTSVTIGSTTYNITCTAEEAETDTVIRLQGQHRHETSLKTADEMKEVLGVEKFDTIIVADGYEFYDALSGSYLAAVKKAPILLSYSGDDKYAYLNDNNLDYIKANLAENGTVYILGGENAVPTTYDTELKNSKINVKRLGGAHRFDTNLQILEEAGVPAGSEILVCTSSQFADSLSAAATGKPILLVWNERGDLYGNQTIFLSGLENCTFTIIGGKNAVSEKFEEVLGGYGEVVRLAGGNRLQTSVAVAEKYFQNVDQAVLAYAWEFPDGLCGGSLAYAMKAPLILTMTGLESEAVKYATENGITSGIVLGGAARISDASVREIFAMAEDAEITVK